MAMQKSMFRVWLVALGALALSGCVTIPDAIKGSSEMPQQDLAAVMDAPRLFIGQEARFGGKVVNVINQQGKTRLEIATVPSTAGATRAGRAFARADLRRCEWFP
ncbi:putative lipoprotein [Atlantibacter hermannii]|nr:putative lipoprotein [Atlantibacter hermannii]